MRLKHPGHPHKSRKALYLGDAFSSFTARCIETLHNGAYPFKHLCLLRGRPVAKIILPSSKIVFWIGCYLDRYCFRDLVYTW